MNVISVVLPALLAIAFIDHLWHSLGAWLDFRRLQASGALRHRPDEPGRSFRNFLIAQALASATSVLFLRSLAFYLAPGSVEIVRFLGFVSYGDLAVVAGFLLWSWHRSGRRE
ncbi:MAG TPA: hypothetical protein VFR93_02235 [Candidatus Limnocylindrales bacterium]|nr:hypothetical protein [Candidatus Limnocylindrales bacterium]